MEMCKSEHSSIEIISEAMEGATSGFTGYYDKPLRRPYDACPKKLHVTRSPSPPSYAPPKSGWLRC